MTLKADRPAGGARQRQGSETDQVVVATPAAPRSGDPDRLHALDGLRGVAAFIVVIHHLSLIAAPVSQSDGEPAAWSAWWWAERTPLKLLTAGHEAVLVFFVLSGLVVVLPALRRVDFSWPGLIASRFARLFLPAWAAIVLATVLLLVVPRTPDRVTGDSWLARQVQTDWSWRHLLGQYTLLVHNVPYDNVLWTLRWELIFSLLLPAFLVLAILVRRWWVPAGLAAVGCSVVGTVSGIEGFQYLPVFFLGTLIAVRLRAIQTWSASRRAKRVLAAVLLLSALVLIVEFLLAPWVPTGTRGSHALIGIESLGAAGIVVVAAAATRFRRVLEHPVPQFLGRISFSLYLVHLPVLATLAFLLGDWNWPIVVLVGTPLAVLTGWAFFRLVEQRLHAVARTAKRGAAEVVEKYVRSSGGR